MTIQRFLIENHGPIIDNFKLALSESIKFCQTNGINKVTLIVPAKVSFPNTIIGEFFGNKDSKQLRKGASIALGNGISINLKIPSELRNPCEEFGVVLATYLLDDQMLTVDTLKSTKAIVYLPWLEEAGKKWLACWQPSILGTSTWTVTPLTISQEVEDALNRLNRTINVSTGLKNTYDQKTADDIFKQLKKDGHLLNPEVIKHWAIKNSWQAEHAKSLEKLAAKYF